MVAHRSGNIIGDYYLALQDKLHYKNTVMSVYYSSNLNNIQANTENIRKCLWLSIINSSTTLRRSTYLGCPLPSLSLSTPTPECLHENDTAAPLYRAAELDLDILEVIWGFIK